MEVDFNYCDKNEWIRYIKEDIVLLRTRARTLLNFWDYLNNYVGIPVSEVIENELLKVKLMGGVLENGEFKSRSLASLYETLFGWSLYNLNEYLLHKSEDIEIEIITFRSDKTDFIEFIKIIVDYCTNIISSANENSLTDLPDSSYSEIEGKRLFDSDEELMDEIYNLYVCLAKFTINYNPKTLFIWTLRRNTKRNLTFQYKKLQDPKCFESLKKIMGLFEYYSIEIPETKDKNTADKIINDYTIWELKNQFGYNVYCLNDYIFKSFEINSQISILFEHVIKNPEDFQQNHEKKIERLRPLWEIPEEHKKRKLDEAAYGSWEYKYFISGAFLTEFQRSPSQRSRYSWQSGKCSKSLLDFLDALSPALFLNRIDLKISDNWIWYD